MAKNTFNTPKTAASKNRYAQFIWLFGQYFGCRQFIGFFRSNAGTPIIAGPMVATPKTAAPANSKGAARCDACFTNFPLSFAIWRSPLICP
jgi:hypothetical protein